MSDYHELQLLMDDVPDDCIIPNPESIVTQFFIIFDFWPIYLGYIFMGLTLVKCDYSFLLLTTTNFLDYLLNYVIRSAGWETTSYQPETCFAGPHQLSALAAQRVTVLYIVIWFMATFTYPTRISKSNVMFINFSAVLALFSRLYLGFSTPQQMLIGAAIGVGEGLFFSFVFYFLMVRRIDRKFVRLMRNRYTNFTDDFIDHKTHFSSIDETEGKRLDMYTHHNPLG